jgi:hypothetical protein
VAGRIDVDPVKDPTRNKDRRGEVVGGFVADVSHRETDPPYHSIYFFDFQSSRVSGTAYSTADEASEDDDSDEGGGFLKSWTRLHIFILLSFIIMSSTYLKSLRRIFSHTLFPLS